MVTAGALGTGMTRISRNSKSRTADYTPSLERSAVSCGRPWGGGAVAIVDPELELPLPDGDVGEIWVTGPNVGLGYWREGDRGKNTFGARIEGDPRNYLRTGDLGFVQGRELFVTGRIKDTIVVRGSKHAPEDIEATVADSHQAYATHAGAAFALQIAQEEPSHSSVELGSSAS
jgi:acyl-CoA synthetase (AMP-forming)/AMP-acid ligase II